MDTRFFHLDDIPGNMSPPSKPGVDEFIKRYKEGRLCFGVMHQSARSDLALRPRTMNQNYRPPILPRV